MKPKITGKVKISDGSTLIINGENIYIENLVLDGCLIVKAVNTLIE